MQDNPPKTTGNELHDILKPLSDGGYHNNSEDKTRSTCYDCKRIDSAKSKLTKYIEQEIKKAYWQGNQKAIIEESKKPRTTICGICGELQDELRGESNG